MENWDKNKIWVSDIERFAIKDGPGIRTAVFLQGCPLRCPWCANPENLIPGRKLMHLEGKCSGCKTCVGQCGNHAITIVKQKARIDRTKCSVCGKCAEICPNGVNRISAKKMTLTEIYETVMRDKDYYQTSGGGLTLSGGEALLQVEALLPLLKKMKEAGISTAVETCGNVAAEKIYEAIPYVDYFLYDLKSMDQEKLRRITGGDLALIRQNLETIAAAGLGNVILRMPVIPEVNDTKEEILGILQEAQRLSIRRVDLLPYHTLGLTKYVQLGMKYGMEVKQGLNPELLDAYVEIGKQYGLDVRIGG